MPLNFIFYLKKKKKESRSKVGGTDFTLLNDKIKGNIFLSKGNG